MITLYHCTAARSFRPLWALEELGLAYDLKMLPFPPRAFAKQYLALNPLGTIPLLIDGDTRMTESAAVLQYLVTRHGPTPLAVGIDEPGYGAYLNWLHFGEATLTFPLTLVLRYGKLEPEERRSPQVATDYAKWFFGRLRAVEAAVAGCETLCAGRFTVADISVGYALLLAERVGLAKDFGPAVTPYWQRLQERAGFRRAVNAENVEGERQKAASRWW
jgi:glutathione S-transferase